jgi:MoxR-like ATPase
MKDLNLTIRDAGRIKGLSAILMSGEPGVGKTHAAELLQLLWSDLGNGEPVKKIFFQLYENVEKEKLLYDYNLPKMVEGMASNGTIQVKASDIVSEGVLYQAALNSHKGRTLLILDELDKASQEIDVLLLDFLQNGRLSDPMFGEIIADQKNLIVAITSNEQRELNDALYRRLRYVRLPYPSVEKQHKILQKMDKEGYDVFGPTIVGNLISLSMDYRGKDVERKVVVNQLSRLLSDLAVLRNNETDIKKAVCQWFSPYPDDWTVLTKLNGFNKFVKEIYATK